MNVKGYFKAAAVALPLMFGGGKAAAQAQNITKAAEKIIATDTLRTMEQKASDVPTLLIKKYKGSFQGSVVNGKIGNGTLKYKEAGEVVPVHNILNPKSSFSVDGGFINAQNMPAATYRLRGTFTKGNNEFGVATAIAKKGGNNHYIEDISYTRLVPLSRDFAATGKGGVMGEITKINGDKAGSVAPYLTAGVKYNHNFTSGVKVGAKAEVGGAAVIKHNSNQTKVSGGSLIAAGEVEAGYKNVSAFVNGGKDAILGNNIGVGARLTF